MKRKIMFLLMLGFIILTVGCSDSSETNSSKYKDKGVEYVLVENIPQDVVNGISNIKEKRGYKVIDSEEEGNFIFIGLGEKPTGGYDLAVEEIEREDDVIKITILEYQPKTNDMVTQALTYPYIVIKVEDEVEELKVVTTKRKELEKIELEDY